MNTFAKVSIVAALAMSFAGCVATNMRKGLDTMVGHPAQDAVDVLGLPSDDRVIMGQHVYFWNITGCYVKVSVDQRGIINNWSY